MPKYRIDAVVWSDEDEETVGQLVENTLWSRFNDVPNLSVYEVAHLPSYADQERAKRGLG